MQRILVVGAGFSGAVVARELAESGCSHVTVIDRRCHVAGNAYDPIHEQSGNRFHRYGPHIFHTNSKPVVEYLSKFTEWLPYKHCVRAILPSGRSGPMPINRDTLNTHYNLELVTEYDVKSFLDNVREPVESPSNAKEYLSSLYGSELTELFFGRYTRKMWGLQLEDMPVSVVSRLPVRFDDNPLYFDDTYQMMPKDGYVNMIAAMLSHPCIELSLDTPFTNGLESQFTHVFNSMPIDEYFDNAFGPLPYRSIKFEHRFNEQFVESVPTVNFTDDGPYTRKTCWALYPGCGGLAGEHVTYETPCSYEDNNMERYYPVKTIDGWPQRRYKQYQELANSRNDMTFIGRCGQYIYYDMHQAVANSLKIARTFVKSHR